MEDSIRQKTPSWQQDLITFLRSTMVWVNDFELFDLHTKLVSSTFLKILRHNSNKLATEASRKKSWSPQKAGKTKTLCGHVIWNLNLFNTSYSNLILDHFLQGGSAKIFICKSDALIKVFNSCPITVSCHISRLIYPSCGLASSIPTMAEKRKEI